jgi:hypothetical protein
MSSGWGEALFAVLGECCVDLAGDVAFQAAGIGYAWPSVTIASQELKSRRKKALTRRQIVVTDHEGKPEILSTAESTPAASGTLRSSEDERPHADAEARSGTFAAFAASWSEELGDQLAATTVRAC